MLRGFVVLVIIISSFVSPKASFKTAQLKYPRVKAAFQDKGKLMANLYKSKQLNIKNAHVFIRVFNKKMNLNCGQYQFPQSSLQK